MKIRNFPDRFMGTNSYLVTDDGKNGFIIDAGEYNKQLVKMVEDEGISVKWLILTHGHGDHIGGVEEYLKVFDGCKLVAGEHERILLSNPEYNLSSQVFGKSIVLEADLYVKDGDELDCGDIKLKIIATPGHTTGGISILAENALFSGDTLFQASIGRTDFPGGSYEVLLSSIREKLFVLPDETNVFPGHMGATTIGYEKKHNPFL